MATVWITKQSSCLPSYKSADKVHTILQMERTLLYTPQSSKLGDASGPACPKYNTGDDEIPQ
jgi:hypothetical protein